MFWRKSLQFGGATDPKLKNVDRGGTDVPINLGVSATNSRSQIPRECREWG
jgi:hypothetical protein